MEVHLTVMLGLHDQAKLDQLIADQQNPSSSQYRRWLTPQEFNQRFGPTPAQTDAVVEWLKRNSDSPIPTHKTRKKPVGPQPTRQDRGALRSGAPRPSQEGPPRSKTPAESHATPRTSPPLRGLMAVAATLMRRRHRARVEDLAMPAKKTLALSEQLARRLGKRGQDAQLFHFRFIE
jgi:Pro-kumamolisin, activation domain